MKMNLLRIIPSSTLDILLRIPFLFIIDNTLNTELPSIIRTQHVEAVESVDRLSGNGTKLNKDQYKLCLLKDIGKDTLSLFDRFFESTINIDDCPPQSLLIFLVIIIPLISFIFKSAVIALAGLASVLDSEYLRDACANFVSVLMAYYSYRSSSELVRAASSSRDGTLALLLYSNSQLLTALLLSRCLLNDTASNLFQRCLRVLLFVSLQLPLVLSCVGAPNALLTRSPMLSVCPAACLINARLLGNSEKLIGQAVRAVRHLCRQVRALGIEGVIEQHWVRLRVPLVLRVFWSIKAAYYLVTMLMLPATASTDSQPVGSDSASSIATGFLSILQTATLGRGSENLLSLLGMTSVISWLSQLIVLCFARFISLHDNEEWQYGTVSAMLFFLLALQAGITGLPSDERIGRLYRNLCLMISALLHFVHNMCQQVMQRVASAPAGVSLGVHLRVLSLCLFLLLSPMAFLYVLWTSYEPGAWILAVTAFSVEVLFKVLFTLLLYTASMLEAWREGTFEDLDETLYYIRGASSVVEFVFGIFLFFNGGYIFIFESGGIIRGVMLLIHAYFNIWQQAVNGLQALRNRWLSLARLNSLASASEELLVAMRDVCAICYSDLIHRDCKVTPCRHVFHSACIRRWISVSMDCPMCHQTMFT